MASQNAKKKYAIKRWPASSCNYCKSCLSAAKILSLTPGLAIFHTVHIINC